MPAISEYAHLASRQNSFLRAPSNLGDIVRWLLLLLGAYLALRLLAGLFGGGARR